MQLTPADVGGTRDRDRYYQQQHPAIAAWLAQRTSCAAIDNDSLPPVDPPPQYGNGGW